jgi:hypothetical protein
MRNRCYLLLVPVLIGIASPASAVLQFQLAFKKEYIDTLKDKKFAEEVNKADVKCLMCHQGKNRKNHNAFGLEVKKLLTKKDAKNTEKIAAALKKALAMHVDPKNEKSETYMDRLQAGKWPGGKLEDLKKDPKKEAGKDSAAEGEKKE